jgi:hypothetical protein
MIMNAENIEGFIQQFEESWAHEVGVGMPTPERLHDWATATARNPDLVFQAIKKTGIRVKEAARRGDNFAPGQAVAFASNIVRSFGEGRSVNPQVGAR